MTSDPASRTRNGVRALFLCYFLFVGTLSPYLTLYLNEVGLGVAAIGLVMSLSPASRIIGPLAWGGSPIAAIHVIRCSAPVR